MNKHALRLARALSLFVIASGAGCVDDPAGEDGRDDDFLTPDGKSDVGGIVEDSPEARGVLRVVNELTGAALRDDVGLSTVAARNLVAHRDGTDQVGGTSDDDTFGSLAELDAIPWVGPASLAKLLAFAIDNGFVDLAPEAPDLALPGPACEGQFTELGRLHLFETKPITGLPAFMHQGNGANGQARKLGPYTGTFYTRSCDTAIGCETWTASDPTTDGYLSNIRKLRSGQVYLWRDGSSPGLQLATVSENVGTEWAPGSRCDGWAQGFGNVLPTGAQASVTLAVEEQHSCPGGISPYPVFQGRDLHDPTGIVTDHCFKLAFSMDGYRSQISPDRFVYKQYLVVYDAAY